MFWDLALPEALWMLIPWTIIAFAVMWGVRKKRRQLEFWLSLDDLRIWWRWMKWKIILLSLASLILITAMAQPKLFAGKTKVKVQGVDVVICMDVSHSMLCDDIKPSRLEVAQTIINNLIEKLSPEDRLGMVLFAGSAFPVPLTHDRNVMRTYLSLLDPSVMVYNPTTYLEKGLKSALQLLQRRQSKQRRGGVIIILSDGEDQGSEWKKSVKECIKARVTVFVFPIGTEQGSLVPEVTDNGDFRGYKRDLNGKLVLSKLNMSVLSFIAYKTGGKVYLTTDGRKEVDMLIKDLSGYRKNFWVKEVAQWTELFPALVMLAVSLLIVETGLVFRVRKYD